MHWLGSGKTGSNTSAQFRQTGSNTPIIAVTVGISSYSKNEKLLVNLQLCFKFVVLCSGTPIVVCWRCWLAAIYLAQLVTYLMPFPRQCVRVTALAILHAGSIKSRATLTNYVFPVTLSTLIGNQILDFLWQLFM